MNNDLKKGGPLKMENFIPKVPKSIEVPVPPDHVNALKEKLEGAKKAPSIQRPSQSQPQTEETLLKWISNSARAAVKTAPSMAKVMGIQLGIVLAINVIFWQIETWKLPSGLGNFVMLVVFLTATYNNILPKTIYWVIVFTFGKRIFKRLRKEGFQATLEPIKNLLPEFKKSIGAIQEKAYSILLIGGGVGLIVANNFASYSRFSGARNKIDKYFVALVISFTVSYILGEGRKNGIVKFITLAIQDLSRLFHRSLPEKVDDLVFVLLGGFVLGLLFDAPLILMKFMYGGYILGILAILVGVGLQFFSLTKSK